MIFKIENQKTGEIWKQWELLPKQEEFVMSERRYNLFSGGFGGGKTFAVILKTLKSLLEYPGNLGLLGRMTYGDLRDTVQRDFMEVCPKFWIKSYLKSEHKLILFNGSELLFRHLDKVSEQEIKSLNLGFFAIDQAEQVTEPVYLALKGRLRREKSNQQGFMSSNPANTWLFREFKQDNRPENLLIETATTDNKHLPKAYIDDLMRYPDSWKKQFVYGQWDTAIMGDRNIYPAQWIEQFNKTIIKPEDCKMFDDVRIYENKVNQEHTFQMGIDVSEGIGGDASCISVVNTNTGEESAFWMGQMPPDVLAKKAKSIVDYFNLHTKSRMLVVPEINSIGVGFLSSFKKLYPMIYRREVFNKRTSEKKEVLGWKTSVATKPLLFTNHMDMMRHSLLKVHTPELVEQMKTFVYTDEVKKQGMGADVGFHDDAVIAHALACFFSKPQKMRLMSMEKNKKGQYNTREAYNPIAEPISSLFEKTYDIMTDSQNYD